MTYFEKKKEVISKHEENETNLIDFQK